MKSREKVRTQSCTAADARKRQEHARRFLEVAGLTVRGLVACPDAALETTRCSPVRPTKQVHTEAFRLLPIGNAPA